MLCAPSQLRLHHVGVVLHDRRQADDLLALLGLSVTRRQFVERYRAECLFVDAGPVQVELILPDGGPLAGFNRGVGGLHHLAFEVADLEQVAARLAAAGLRLLEDHPVSAGALRINFLPPEYTRGLVIEFVEPMPARAAAAGDEP